MHTYLSRFTAVTITSALALSVYAFAPINPTLGAHTDNYTDTHLAPLLLRRDFTPQRSQELAASNTTTEKIPAIEQASFESAAHDVRTKTNYCLTFTAPQSATGAFFTRAWSATPCNTKPNDAST